MPDHVKGVAIHDSDGATVSGHTVSRVSRRRPRREALTGRRIGLAPALLERDSRASYEVAARVLAAA